MALINYNENDIFFLKESIQILFEKIIIFTGEYYSLVQKEWQNFKIKLNDPSLAPQKLFEQVNNINLQFPLKMKK